MIGEYDLILVERLATRLENSIEWRAESAFSQAHPPRLYRKPSGSQAEPGKHRLN